MAEPTPPKGPRPQRMPGDVGGRGGKVLKAEKEQGKATENAPLEITEAAPSDMLQQSKEPSKEQASKEQATTTCDEKIKTEMTGAAPEVKLTPEQQAPRAAAADSADDARMAGNKPVEARHRGSTIATELFDMCLISAKNFIKLYDGEDAPRLDAWQVLNERGFLVKYADLPAGAKTYFISHEWHGFAHPDPSRVKTKALIRILQRLDGGEIPLVDVHWKDQMIYSDQTTTKAAEWNGLLENAYLWFDWCSMPQPGAVPKPAEGTEPTEEEKAKMQQLEEDSGSFLRSKSYHRPTITDEKEENEKMRILREDGGKAIRSIPAYIERSDMVVVVAPPGTHEDRKEDTSYRSWRSRGWCMMELYACLFSRHKDSPVMVINSAEGTPFYINPGQALWFMSVGGANFSCCQRNHRPFNLTATQQVLLGDTATIPCDKPVVASILAPLIDGKIAHLHAAGNLHHARFYLVLKRWALRGLRQEKEEDDESKQGAAAGEGRGTDEEEDAVRMFGRHENIEMWLTRFKDWDVNFLDTCTSALGYASYYIGSVPIIKRLIEAGAHTNLQGPTGYTPLMWAAENEGANPGVVALLLEHIMKLPRDECADAINMRACPRSTHWKDTLEGSMDAYRRGTAESENAMVKHFAHLSGKTAVHAAAGRGDVAIVRQLLAAGADPSIKNDLGLDVIEYSKLCGPFPAVEAVLAEYSTCKLVRVAP
eukprot:g3867.t1